MRHRLLAFLTVTASLAAFAQQGGTPQTVPHRKAVRVFDDENISEVKGHLASGDDAAPASLPTAAEKSATEGSGAPATADKSSAQASATANPHATPEEVKKLQARQQSLESTLKQIDEDINTTQDATRREGLQLMRNNVEANLTEIKQELAAQSAPSQQPSAKGTGNPENETKPPSTPQNP